MVALAAPAHADANSYLTYLNEHGIITGYFVDAKKVEQGLTVCRELRAGMSREMIIGPIVLIPDPNAVIDAAQHELCPDTL
jgi:hypothetical protein